VSPWNNVLLEMLLTVPQLLKKFSTFQSQVSTTSHSQGLLS